MSAAVSTQDTRFLLSMTPPPPSDREERERERVGRFRTLLDLLTTEKMDGSDSTTRATASSSTESGGSRWRILRERLGLTGGIGCCGTATWRYGSPPEDAEDDNNENQNDVVGVELQQRQEAETVTGAELPFEPERRSSGMNLAAALAAERQYRAVGTAAEESVATPRTPMRVSLMRLLEETGGEERENRERGVTEREEGEGRQEEGNDSMCCVCMGRKKGAALIPCGHTYCRVCSREVWVNRGACPLCNRPILEILDIF